MDYYERKKEATKYINKCVSSTKKGNEMDYSKVELEVQMRFGFSGKALEKLLRPFEDTGKIKVEEDKIVVTK